MTRAKPTKRIVKVTAVYEVESAPEAGKADAMERDIRLSLQELPLRMTSAGVNGWYSLQLLKGDDMTTEATATEAKEERTWCRSVTAPGEDLYFYVYRPSPSDDLFCISFHVIPGAMAQCRPSRELLRELHRVIGDALLGEVEERDDAEPVEGGTT